MYETCYPRIARRPHGNRGLEVRVMKRFPLIAAVLIAALGALAPGAAQAAGLERLYILNCGEGVAGDISRWSPGVNVGQSMPFVDNCYLLKHAQGWLLWDTGVPDAIAAMPDGQKPADPVLYLPNADKYRGLARRPSKEQKGLDERTLMAPPRPFHPW